jgi:DNA-binding transcriptional ArsR family regulator
MSAVNWQRVAASMLHPTQIAIVQALDGNVRSPRQLADETGIPLDNLSHHVRVLAKAGALTLVDQRRHHGGMQHFYRLTP